MYVYAYTYTYIYRVLHNFCVSSLCILQVTLRNAISVTVSLSLLYYRIMRNSKLHSDSENVRFRNFVFLHIVPYDRHISVVRNIVRALSEGTEGAKREETFQRSIMEE